MGEHTVLDEKKYVVEMDDERKLTITKRFVDVDSDYMDDMSYTEFEFEIGGVKGVVRFEEAGKLSYFMRKQNAEQVMLKPSAQREARAKRKAQREAKKTA